MHYKRPPAPATREFIDAAPLVQLKSGTRAVVEIIAYPGGHVRLVASEISGPSRERRITQGPFLMFVDADEAKDALDQIVDRAMGSAQERMFDAREHLGALVGQTIDTLSGRPNTILRIDGDDVLVGTQRSPSGQPVPIKSVQDAINELVEKGEIAIEVTTVGYRSAFIGAVLATLPGSVVMEGTRRIRLDR